MNNVRTGIGIKLALVTGSVVFTLVLLEVTLRLLGAGYDLIYRPPVDNSAAYRILCMGESTTWGIGATDWVKKGYPHVLQEKLNARYKDRSVQCLYNNMIGKNTSEMLYKLPGYIRQYRPQLMILMVGANNYWNMESSNILIFGRTVFHRFNLKAMIFLDHFRVWKLLKNVAFSWGLFRENWTGLPDNEEIQRREKAYGRDIYDDLAEHDMEEMIRLAQSAGIKVIMASYPVEGHYLERKKLQLSQKYDIPFVDNHSVFRDLPSKQEYFWKDNWHPNDRGYALLADNFYQVIVDRKLME